MHKRLGDESVFGCERSLVVEIWKGNEWVEPGCYSWFCPWVGETLSFSEPLFLFYKMKIKIPGVSISWGC